VCLDCGKQFGYDLKKMRIGKPLPISPDQGVLPAGMPEPRRSKLKLAAIASALPVGIALGSILTLKRQRKRQLTDGKPDEAAKGDHSE
jgi:hypothetical protein